MIEQILDKLPELTALFAAIGGPAGYLAKGILDRYDQKIKSEREDRASELQQQRKHQESYLELMHEINKQANATATRASEISTANQAVLRQVETTLRSVTSGIREILDIVQKPSA